MARPKKDHELDADAYIGVRVAGDIREALESKAAAAGRTLAQEVRLAFARHVGAIPADRKKVRK